MIYTSEAPMPDHIRRASPKRACQITVELLMYGRTVTYPNWCRKHQKQYDYGSECPRCAGEEAAQAAINALKRELETRRTAPSEGGST